MKDSLSKIRQRPFGVLVIIIVLIVLAVTFGADLIRIAYKLPPNTLPDLPGETDWIIFAALLVFYVILSVGLWRMHTWAWFAAMIAGGLMLFYCIWHYLNGGTPYITMTLVIIMVLYLNLVEVKAAFQPKAREERL